MYNNPIQYPKLLNDKVNNNKNKSQVRLKYDAIHRKLMVGGTTLGVLTRFLDP